MTLSNDRRDYTAAEQAAKETRREQAGAVFPKARDIAKKKGFTLIQRSASHYQLRGGRWLINLYPGNQRIYIDRQKQNVPFLQVPTPWTILDVIEAASKAIKTEGEADG